MKSLKIISVTLTLTLLLICSITVAQNNFTRGNITLFEDNQSSDKIGGLPSKWTVLRGGAKIEQAKGEKAISFSILFKAAKDREKGEGTGGTITPVLKTPINHLPECLLTIEFDFLTKMDDKGAYVCHGYNVRWNDPVSENVNLYIDTACGSDGQGGALNGASGTIRGNYLLSTTGKGDTFYASRLDMLTVGWHRIALSFNRGKMDIFLDGKHVVNAQDVQQPGFFSISGEHGTSVRNVRITSDKTYMTAAEMAAKLKFTPFTPGSEIIFEDKFVNEKPGTAPSKWEIVAGKVGVARFNGENVLSFPAMAIINPKVSTPQNYLPENYTIELDFYAPYKKNTRMWSFQLSEPNKENELARLMLTTVAGGGALLTEWKTSNREEHQSMVKFNLLPEGWHRLSLSYNQKKGLNIYIDEILVAEAGNAARAGWFTAWLLGADSKTDNYLRNVRIAKSDR